MSKPLYVSDDNKRVARHVAAVFGGTPHVTEHVHDASDLSLGILWCENRPTEGVTSYSTVRLSDYIMERDGQEYPARVEIAGACASDQREFSNVIAAAGLCVMRTRRLLYPGAALAGYVAEYFPHATVPHLYFTAPFLWGEKLNSFETSTKHVHWLLAVPISDAELQYLVDRGDQQLEARFEERQIDIFDLTRKSVV